MCVLEVMGWIADGVITRCVALDAACYVTPCNCICIVVGGKHINYSNFGSFQTGNLGLCKVVLNTGEASISGVLIRGHWNPIVNVHRVQSGQLKLHADYLAAQGPRYQLYTLKLCALSNSSSSISSTSNFRKQFSV